MANDDICGCCGLSSPPVKKGARKAKKSPSITWINCDQCLNWFHAVCVKISETRMQKVQDFLYHCENCSIRGSLIPKVAVTAHPESSNATLNNEIEIMKKTISEITSQLAKLQAELDNIRLATKKQMDQLRNKLHNSEHSDNQCATRISLMDRIGEKLDQIETGARLAGTCSSAVNSCRISINKIPFSEGENLRKIVKSVLVFLGLENLSANVVNCFRLQVKPSKWSDRSLTPTIVVILDSKTSRDTILRKYFENHKKAHLAQHGSVPQQEYRFTINEVLSPNTFRIRNLALRLKQQKLVKSVFIRNDSLSILLPNAERYVPVNSTDHLLQLVKTEDSSVFFDAISADASASSLC